MGAVCRGSAVFPEWEVCQAWDARSWWNARGRWRCCSFYCNAGAFDPEQVKVMNLSRGLPAMTAKQVLDVVAMSFDHPIQYVVMDHGVMFFQQDPQFANTVTRTFTLNLNTRSLAQLGIQTPQLGGGGGKVVVGGGQGGGGQVLEVKVLAVRPDGGYPGGDAGGEMMQKQNSSV